MSKAKFLSPFTTGVHERLRRGIFSGDFWSKIFGGKSSAVPDKASPLHNDSSNEGDWDNFWDAPNFQTAVPDHEEESFLGEIAAALESDDTSSDLQSTVDVISTAADGGEAGNGGSEEEDKEPELDVSNLKLQVAQVFQLPQDFEISLTPPIHPLQKQQITYNMTEPFGTFSSPGYPRPYKVDRFNYTTTWNINVAKGSDIKLKFFNFAVGSRDEHAPDKTCKRSLDFVVVNSVPNQRWVLCDKDSRLITISGHTAMVKLMSRIEQPFSDGMGFFAAYKEIPTTSSFDREDEREQVSSTSRMTTLDTPFDGRNLGDNKMLINDDVSSTPPMNASSSVPTTDPNQHTLSVVPTTGLTPAVTSAVRTTGLTPTVSSAVPAIGPPQNGSSAVLTTGSSQNGSSSVPTTGPSQNGSSAVPTTGPYQNGSSAVPSTGPSQNGSSASPTTDPSQNGSSAVPSTGPSQNGSAAVPTTGPSQNVSTAVPSTGPSQNGSAAVPSTGPSQNGSAAVPSTGPSQNGSAAVPSTGPSQNGSAAVPSTGPSQNGSSASPTTGPSQNGSSASACPTTGPSQNGSSAVSTMGQSKNGSSTHPTTGPSQNGSSACPTTGPSQNGSSNFAETNVQISPSVNSSVGSGFPGEPKVLDSNDADGRVVSSTPLTRVTGKHTSLSPATVAPVDLMPKGQKTEYAPGGFRLYTMKFDLNLSDADAVYSDGKVRDNMLGSILAVMKKGLKNSYFGGDYSGIHGLRLISKGNRLATLETAIEMLPSSTVSMKVIEGIIGSAMQTSQWNTTAASAFNFQAASMRSSDLDECALGWHTCPQYADCINTDGSYTCHCKKGYVASGNAEQRVCVEKGETRPGDNDSDMWKKVTLIVSPIAVALLLCIVFIVICVTRRRHHRYKEDYSMTGRATPGSYNRHDSQARSRKEWRDSQHESDSTGFTRV
ncbi:uncharacterized protein LOC118419991 [Branchiostoma floridae]|uniref:Uncharacterized protein LOC118419991 n=1 Tax=Branchiostoma floridae TaxID=7739 RepID=A0A9J7MVA1_BRAFL|nr:uncharacterized protein LOC118419991 [Branchiostoma floridae]